MTDLDLVRMQLASAFVFNGAGRIVCVNDPGRSSASKAVFAGCDAGNMCCFRNDVDEACVREVRALFETEPPLSSCESRPRHAEAYAHLLSDRERDAAATFALSWHLPHDTVYPSDARVVFSDSAEGAVLLERFRGEGVPTQLFDMGFTDTGEFWAPWCAVFCGDEIASLGFAARLGTEAADLGLVTVPAFRGRGFGAVATAAWAAHQALASRTLFYSTAVTNLSSQRVVARLGLRFIGAGFRID